MAYKFFQGTFKTDGILDVNNAVTGNSLLVDTGGISVTNGNIVATTSQLTASTVSASSAQFGSLTVSTLSAPNLDLTGYLIVSGNSTLGTDAADIVQVKGQLTASAGLSASAGIFATIDINGGSIDGVGIGVVAQGSGQFTTLSASSTLQVGGVATLQNLTASLVDINGGTIDGTNVTVGAGKTLDVSGGTLTLAAGQVGASKVGPGTFNAGTFSFNGSTISDLGSVTTADINGGTIDNTVIGQTTQALGKFTSVSSSGDVFVGGDLRVNGTTTYINSTNLVVTDKKVVIASGSATQNDANEAGIYISKDDGTEYASLAYDGINDRWDMKAVAGLHLSGANQQVLMNNTTVLQQTALFGGAVTGSNLGVGLRLNYTPVSSDITASLSGYVYAVDTAAARRIELPPVGAGAQGRVLLFKDSTGNASANNITIAPSGSDTIDGVNANIVLNSNYAALSFICAGANKWLLF
ncbi:MAG: hypothetical protein RIR47_1030 [Bacteroidota bacterium]|jgi:hypothetical protein